MKFGEVREVEDSIATFFIANGWAKDVDGAVPVGERGKLDYEDPEAWAKKQQGEEPSSQSEDEDKPKRGTVKPKDVIHRKRG